MGLVVIFSIFFLAALSLQVGKSSSENLPMLLVLRFVGWMLLYSAYLTIPLAVLTTGIVTYGRASQDGEIAAAQTSGIPLARLLVPAWFLGACATLALTVLQDRVMPEAHFRSRHVDESVFQNVDQILKRKDRRIQEKSFLFTWQTVEQDHAGNLVLGNIELVQYRDDKPEAWSHARRARPVAEPGTARVMLELEDVRRAQTGGALWAGSLAVPIDLSALVAPRKRGASDLTYDELLTNASLRSDDSRSRRFSAEFHFRFAMALAPVLLGALAAPIGIAFRIRNRAVVFLTGVLIMAIGYLPLVEVARALAERGVAPAWAALQAPNVILLVAAVLLTRKAQRP